MVNDLSWSIEELLPHAHPMILIDEVCETDEGDFYSLTRIAEDSLYYEPGKGVPTYVGIEYVAQTVAALAGLKSRRADGGVKLGYLLGTRRFTATDPYFPIGTLLTTMVASELESSALSKYIGTIRDETGRLIVETSVTLYSGELH
jgi:predicted hotdog family 3-hydroxylacyl-ACP dehydratase